MLTGRENIHLSGAILGLSKDEIAKKFDSIVEFSGLQELIDTPVKQYSSGMYVRLGFAVAVSIDPDILIIDESMAVGDAAFRKRCLEQIDAFIQAGKTIIVVTRNLQEIEENRPTDAAARSRHYSRNRPAGRSHRELYEFAEYQNSGAERIRLGDKRTCDRDHGGGTAGQRRRADELFSHP